MRTKCFEPLQKSGGNGLDPVSIFKPRSNLILTVTRRYFCCGSSMLHIAMFVCILSSAILSPELKVPIMLPLLFCFVI